MGAAVWGRDGNRLPPIAMRGGPLPGIIARHAGGVGPGEVLRAAGRACGRAARRPSSSPGPSRDHTERLLRAGGAPSRAGGSGPRPRHGARRLDRRAAHPRRRRARRLSARRPSCWWPRCWSPTPDLAVVDVGLNPTRTGLLDVLQAMGATCCQRRRPRTRSAARTRRPGTCPGGRSGAHELAAAVDVGPAAGAPAHRRAPHLGAGGRPRRGGLAPAGRRASCGSRRATVWRPSPRSCGRWESR